MTFTALPDIPGRVTLVFCPRHEWAPASFSPDDRLEHEVCVNCTVIREVKNDMQLSQLPE